MHDIDIYLTVEENCNYCICPTSLNMCFSSAEIKLDKTSQSDKQTHCQANLCMKTFNRTRNGQ